MGKSKEGQKSRRQRRDEERKIKKFGPLYRKIQELDVRLQIMSTRLGQLSAIMRNFTVCIMVLKDKGILNDEEIGAKDAELAAKRDAELNKDSKNPESGIVQPKDTGDDESDSSDGGRELSGEGSPDSSGGGESPESPREDGRISSEADSGDTPSGIGGDD